MCIKTLNNDKGRFWQKSVKSLGHLVSQDGIRPDPAKVGVIKKYPTPTNRTELRRVIGILNQLAKFIPGLATMNTSMRELLKESSEWTWGPAQDKAFADIKERLMSMNVMAHYNPKLRTIVYTDASQSGLGAAMFQIQEDGSRRPVSYASRSLTETEKNYAVIEKEALGMVRACDKHGQFLRGSEFVLETDHKPLVRLMNTKNLDQIPARVLRMKLRLMRYGPEVSYVPGSQNHLADALSKIRIEDPTVQDIQCLEGVEEASRPRLAASDPLVVDVREAQKSDPICQEISRRLKDGWGTYKTDVTLPYTPIGTRRTTSPKRMGYFYSTKGC